MSLALEGSPLIAASILSADFSVLGSEIQAIDRAGSDWVHIDVMDGHFVPNLTFGAPVIRSVRRFSGKPFDVHLMIEPVEPLLDAFIEAGADRITFHPDADKSPWEITRYLSEHKVSAGIALSPAMPLNAVENLLGEVDLLMVMGVEPGFGGQSFMPETLEKIAQARAMIEASGHDVYLQVDGGINSKTASRVVRAGADVLVAGSAIFRGGAGKYKENIRKLRG